MGLVPDNERLEQGKHQEKIILLNCSGEFARYGQASEGFLNR